MLLPVAFEQLLHEADHFHCTTIRTFLRTYHFKPPSFLTSPFQYKAHLTPVYSSLKYHDGIRH